MLSCWKHTYGGMVFSFSQVRIPLTCTAESTRTPHRTLLGQVPPEKPGPPPGLTHSGPPPGLQGQSSKPTDLSSAEDLKVSPLSLASASATLVQLPPSARGVFVCKTSEGELYVWSTLGCCRRIRSLKAVLFHFKWATQADNTRLQKDLNLARNETERAINIMRDTQFKHDRLEVSSS